LEQIHIKIPPTSPLILSQLSLGEISTNEGIRFVATMRPIIEIESDQQTQVLLEDTKKFLEEKMSALKDTIEFEFISMKDRILELESDRTKFKVTFSLFSHHFFFFNFPKVSHFFRKKPIN
jgi:DNA repair photolyase